ncbi:MAG: TRAP transporter small permease [Deltaproteobacteria bacterium]|nr:TRAP transporter small permease [Deltaproteobacteria bacterium]
MKVHDRLFQGLRKLLFVISVTGMGLMLALIFMQVINRYVLGFVFSWTEELARFLFVWVVFIGGALIMGEDGHMAVKLLPEILKKTKAGLILDIVISIASAAFVLIMIFYGTRMSKMMMFQTAPGLGIPMGIVYAIIPVSGLLMLFYLIQNVFVAIRKRSKETADQQGKE